MITGLYPSAGAALLFAFNDSLFSGHQPPGWVLRAEQAFPSAVSSLTDTMTRSDWLAQSGMVRGYLRRNMRPADYAWLRITHTYDESFWAVWLAWIEHGIELVANSPRVRDSIKRHPKIFLELIRRAVSPSHEKCLPVPPEGLRFETLRKWCWEVDRVCEAETQRVRRVALMMIEGHENWTGSG